MPRALVTGGAGFLGGHLADALAGAGFEVRLLDVAEPADTPYELVRGDVRDAGAVRRAVDGCEVVVDNAALVPVTSSSAAEYRSVNVDGCRVTLEAARDSGAYALHISSSAIFGLPTRLPVTRATPLRPFEPYGASKAEAERVVAELRGHGMTIGSLRPRTLLGAGRLGIFDVIFARVRAGRRVPLFGRGDNRIQLCAVEDFCAAAVAAVERRTGSDFNIGAGEFGTVREDIEALIDHAGTGARPIGIPVWALRAAMQPMALVGASPLSSWHWRTAPMSFYFDLSDARRELGWEPRYSNAQALARAYDAYLASPGAAGESTHTRSLSGLVGRLLRS